ncbi:trypsin-like peptidase domain-containing protein [Phormidium tenue FACHB-886]|nr:trypsin-like peptidase domain-containing protein [Phormidium tenue FACHB-886]
MIDQLSADLVALADRLRQSTVQIRGERSGVGSGVIWQPDGLIVTNAHVLSRREAVVDLWDGRTLPAQVVRRDVSRDLAVLQVSTSGLPAATVGDADRLRVGEWLFAMGNPLGTVGALTIGILCATPDPRWIQADIRLAPGNSGGLLANAQGEVVGINSMIVNGLGFAIPSRIVQRFLQSNRPTLGVTLQPVRLRRRLGFLVLEVAIDSVAAGIPLLVGDVITELDGQTFTSPYALSDILDGRSLNEPLQITVLRGDRKLTCEVILPTDDATQEAA